MSGIDNLKALCQKFIEKKYSIEDLSQTLSYIAVPSDLRDVITDAEYQLEKIRFCVSDDDHYDEGLKVVNILLSKIGGK